MGTSCFVDIRFSNLSQTGWKLSQASQIGMLLDHLGPVCLLELVFEGDFGSGFSKCPEPASQRWAKNLSWQKRQEAFRFLLWNQPCIKAGCYVRQEQAPIFIDINVWDFVWWFQPLQKQCKNKKRGVKNHSQQLGTCWTCWARQKQHEAQKPTKVTHHFP